MSWFTTIFIRSKPAVTNDEKPGTSSAVGSTVVSKPAVLEPEYNFLCGICHGYLVQPCICPFCRYKACEKCFHTWLQQCRSLHKLSTCPQCEVELDKNSLVHVPSLDDLDKRLDRVEEYVKKLEGTLADLLADFTGVVEKMAAEIYEELSDVRKSFVDRMQEHVAEVTIAIEEMKANQNVLKSENEKQQTVANTEVITTAVKENQKPTNSKKVVGVLPTPRKVISSNVPIKHNVASGSKVAPIYCHRAPTEKRKLPENDVPKSVSKVRKTEKILGGSSKSKNT